MIVKRLIRRVKSLVRRQKEPERGGSLADVLDKFSREEDERDKK